MSNNTVNLPSIESVLDTPLQWIEPFVIEGIINNFNNDSILQAAIALYRMKKEQYFEEYWNCSFNVAINAVEDIYYFKYLPKEKINDLLIMGKAYFENSKYFSESPFKDILDKKIIHLLYLEMAIKNHPLEKHEDVLNYFYKMNLEDFKKYALEEKVQDNS